jgi:uncharacterized integral membrane protein
MLHILIEIVRLPYDYWKHTTENSGFGPSKLEENTLRFWKWFALIGTILLVVLFVIVPIINKS